MAELVMAGAAEEQAGDLAGDLAGELAEEWDAAWVAAISAKCKCQGSKLLFITVSFSLLISLMV